MPVDLSTLSINEGFQKGISETPNDGSGDDEGKKKEDDATSPTGDDDKGGDGVKPPETGDGEKPPVDDKAKAPDGTEDGKEPDGSVIDPAKGKYQGEYTKERFDGLMSLWQKDQAATAQKIEQLTQQVSKLAEPGQQKPPADPANKTAEIPLPAALQNADDDAKAAFQTIMASVADHTKNLLATERAAIEKAVIEKINAPKQEEERQLSALRREHEEMTITYGKEYSEIAKDVAAWADKQGYPAGTLKQAFHAYKEIQNAKKGVKTVEDFDKEKKKDGDIPNTGRNRKDVLPQFDEERDGNLSIGELVQKGMKG